MWAEREDSRIFSALISSPPFSAIFKHEDEGLQMEEKTEKKRRRKVYAFMYGVCLCVGRAKLFTNFRSSNNGSWEK